MHFFYGLADEKYILYRTEYKKKRGPFDDLCYTEESPVLKNLDPWERNEPSRVFRTTPDTLVQLCLNVIDKFPMQMPYEWSNTDVLRWIRRYGYPHYMRTFRKNMINGRTLLLVDANALCAMNIKNWEDIKHIAYGIRQLFFFEMAKFARSISLPQNELKELYKLFRVKTGPKYEEAKRSHYWRFMKFVREKAPNYNHWEILERWLAFIPDKEFAEVFGEVHRTNLYKCRLGQPVEEPIPRSIFEKFFDYENAPSIYEVIKRGYNKCKHLEIKHLRQSKGCSCHAVPCECHWPKTDYSAPRRMTCLQKQIEDSSSHACLCWNPRDCRTRFPPQQSGGEPLPCGCWPPCECHWKQHEYRGGYTMIALRKGMPHDYCLNYYAKRKRDFSWRTGRADGVGEERGSMARKSKVYLYDDNDEGEGEE